MQTTSMSKPVVVLNKDHCLDLLSLRCDAYKCLQVGLKRDVTLECLALDYHNTSAGSGLPRGRRCFRRKKSRTFANAFNQRGCNETAVMSDRKRKRCTSANSCDKAGFVQAPTLNSGSRSLTSTSSSVQAPTSDTKSSRSLTNVSKQDGSVPAATFDTKSRSLTSASSSVQAPTSDTRSSRSLTNVSKQDGCVPAATFDTKSRSLTSTSSNVQAPTSDTRSSRSLTNVSKQDGCVPAATFDTESRSLTSASSSVQAPTSDTRSSRSLTSVSKQDGSVPAATFDTRSRSLTSASSSVQAPTSDTRSSRSLTNVYKQDGSVPAATFYTKSRSLTCASSSVHAPASDTRSSRSLANVSKQDGSVPATTFDIRSRSLTSASKQDGAVQDATLDTKSRSNSSKQDSSVHAAKVDRRSKIPSASFPDHVGSEKLCTLNQSVQPPTDASDQGCCKNHSTLNRTSVQPLADTFDQAGNVHASTLDGRCEQAIIYAPDQNGSELVALAVRPSCNSKEITKEDFMALLCLSPTQLASRVRKCNRIRTSKYLYIKTRNLWRKICGEVNNNCSITDSEIKLCQRPAYVLLERSNFIDRLALQLIPKSFNLKNLKGKSKSADHKKRSIDLCRKKLHSPNVVLKRDSSLDQVALQKSNVVVASSANSVSMSLVSTAEAKLGSAVPLSTDTTISFASGTLDCKRLSININRDSSLDMLAVQTSESICESSSLDCRGMSTVSSCKAKLTSTVPLSTHASTIHVVETPGPKKLSIAINRDPCIDQLVLGNSDTTVTGSSSSYCDTTSVLSHQPTSKLRLDSVTRTSSIAKLPGECKEVQNDYPNLKFHGDPKVSVPKRAVIKLRRTFSDGWHIIPPDEPGLETSLETAGPKNVELEQGSDKCDTLTQLQSSDTTGPAPEFSGSRNCITESTGSKTATAELVRNRCIIRLARLPTTSPGRSIDDVCNKTPYHGIQPSTNLQNQSTLPSEQTTVKAGPVFRSSARRSFKEMPVPLISCTKSLRRRIKSVPNAEESSLEFHHNENKNPQKQVTETVKTVVPPVKTVSAVRKHSLDCAVVESRVLRGNSKKILEKSDSLNNYNLVEPSISRRVPLKNPLRIKSEFYSSFNMNQLPASSSCGEQDTDGNLPERAQQRLKRKRAADQFIEDAV